MNEECSLDVLAGAGGGGGGGGGGNLGEDRGLILLDLKTSNSCVIWNKN